MTIGFDIEELEKGCHKGDMGDCWSAGTRYSNGFLVMLSYQEANKYYEKACSLNDGLG